MQYQRFLIPGVLLVVLGVFFRYEITSPNPLGFYSKLDRWTGQTYLCSNMGCNRN